MSATAPAGANFAADVHVAVRNEEAAAAEGVKEGIGGEFCLAKGLGSGFSGGVMGGLYGLGESVKCTDVLGE